MSNDTSFHSAKEQLDKPEQQQSTGFNIFDYIFKKDKDDDSKK